MNLTFLTRLRLSTTVRRSTPTWPSEGSRQRIWKSEGKVARVAWGGEGKCNVCLPHSLPSSSSRVSAGVYTKRMSGEQTPTAVNIVLLKNRTLVNVFERVRSGGRGRGWIWKGRSEGGREGWLSSYPPFFFFALYNTSIAVERSRPSSWFNEEPMWNQLPFYRF